MPDQTKDAQTVQQPQNTQAQSAKLEAQPAAIPVPVDNSVKPDKTVKLPEFHSCMASDPVADQEIVRALTPKRTNE